MIEANRRTTLVVGVFVVAVSVLIGAMLIFVGSGTPFARRATLVAHFDDVSGLRSGAWVQLAGVNVGTVKRIVLAEPGAQGARVVLRVAPGVPARLRADATASLKTIGLLGDRVVSLDPGHSPAPLAKGQVVPSLPQAEPEELVAKTGQVAEAAGEAIRRLNEILEGFQRSGAIPHLAATVASLHATVDRARRGPGLLHALIFDGELDAEMRASAQDLKRSTEGIARAATDLVAVARYVRSGQGTVGGLVYDPAIYEGIRTIVGNVARSRILRALIRFSLKEQEQPPQSGPQGVKPPKGR